LTKNQSLVETIKSDFHAADIGEKDIAMLAFAEKLTRSPSRVEKGDVEVLRTHGFKDPDILDITQVAAYYNFVNRIASGLGVELEPFWKNE
jgi:uncharacterized peroxidase-related enzyme